jgi:thiol-disulfide isomerase/thioredoxin
MSRSKPLTKNPTALTAVLSAAAVAGYVAYRFTASAVEQPAAETARSTESHDHTEALAGSLPDVVLDDLAGTEVSLASYAGKPLLINFWATWCAPCLQEIPLLKSFHEAHAEIDVIGIAVDRFEPVLEYAEQMQFNYPVLVGQTGAFDAMTVFHNDAQVMPFSTFTTADGAVLVSHAGILDQTQLDLFAATIEELTAGSIDLEQARERMAGMH